MTHGSKTIRPAFRLALCSTAFALALTTAPAWAQDCAEALMPQPDGCARANSDVTVRMPAGENTERAGTGPGAGFDSAGFSISIDGETVAGAPAPSLLDRQADIAAAQADVDVRYDGLDLRQMLNVSTTDLRATYRAGELVTFRASTNYPAFIQRAEIRIIDRAARGRPVVAILPAQPNGEVAWTMPSDGEGDLAYVIRVYDAKGRYDETVPLDLTRTEAALETHDTTGQVIAAGEGEDRTRLRNIPVRGGRITAFGTGAGSTVRVMGEDIPVDASGAFVTSRILPAGDHVVTVDLNGQRIVRDVEIPRSEWFYVGIGDVTFGKRLDDDLAEADPDYDDTNIDGRLAFYAKGRTQRGYTITTSVDTGEGPLEDAFRRLDEKDPRHVIQRLDPEDMYPTYGDDSSAFDDAPTSGRFHLKVERDASSLTWGDFKADVTGGEFLRSTRSLYGAELRYVSPNVTEGGDPRTKVTLYAAQPDTLPQRDILRGTGGSVYFLTRQDINGASETITVEVVDPETGRVVDRRMLSEGIDYEIDYIQGVLILARPLQSSAGDGGIISDGPIGKYDVNLVAQYEYTPTTGSLDGASTGGRVEVWATDRLRLGVTAMRDNTGTADQDQAGIDLRYQLGELSYVEAEVAQSDGPGFGRSFSTDGGLTITDSGVAGAASALAYRLDGRFDLTELGVAVPGSVGVYYERKEAGFSTLIEDITEDQTLIGIEAEVALSDRLTFGIDAENFDKEGGDRKAEGEVRLAYQINSEWKITGAIGHLDKRTLGDPDETGRRTDVGLRLDWQRSEDLLLYAFGQVTVDEAGGLGDNDRLGVGFDAQLSEKLRFAGEISRGDKGTGGAARLTYSPTADNEVYLGYTLDPTREGPSGYPLVGRDDGAFVIGGRYRVSDAVSTWGENNLDLFGERRSLTRAYGVSYTPDARWTISGGMETGEVRDSINGDFDRDAYSLGVAYAAEDRVAARARLEYRTEDGAGLVQDRDTWAFSGGYEYKVNDDWRFLANVDALYSDSTDSFRDGEYLEASVGYAYRPVMNDRLNLLMRYTYLRDLPGADQVTADGSTDGPKQVSHVLSIDGNYDINEKLTFGGKYGYRRSRIADRGTDVFSDSTAHLGILRLDWHVVHKWDVMGEARMLYTEDTDIRETGALLAVYRHVGNHAKIGIGYEWGRVSDSLTDLDYDGQGVFVNLVAKF